MKIKELIKKLENYDEDENIFFEFESGNGCSLRHSTNASTIWRDYNLPVPAEIVGDWSGDSFFIEQGGVVLSLDWDLEKQTAKEVNQ